MNQSKIKARIQALLAKAKGTDNEHEAEVFMAKAMELLQANQLELGDLADEGDPVRREDGWSQATFGHAWVRDLYCALANLYGCRTVLSYEWRNGRMYTTVELVGRESAIVTTNLMHPWVCAQVRAHAKQVCKITGMSQQGQAKRVGAALLRRVVRMAAANKEAAPRTEAVARNALITMSQVDALAKKLGWDDLEQHRGGRRVTDALSRRAADSIGLNRQTGSQNQTKLTHQG